jgi:hypothetical protein
MHKIYVFEDNKAHCMLKAALMFVSPTKSFWIKGGSDDYELFCNEVR